jgi:hypothetical protein
MRMLIPIAVLSFLVGQKLPSETETPRPKFGDFAVTEIYRGKPAEPKITKDFSLFRTMIRHGAESQVQFAGHYTVPSWGCGMGCTGFAIVDSVSGRIYNGLGVADLPITWLNKENGGVQMERLEFHPDSRLLKISGCPNEANCGFYDYVMTDGKGLTLVRKKLLPQEFQ